VRQLCHRRVVAVAGRQESISESRIVAGYTQLRIAIATGGDHVTGNRVVVSTVSLRVVSGVRQLLRRQHHVRC
jgi:hypothetical protein